MSTKEKLIAALKESRGNWISGELLSERLAVSRAAVSKQVKRLKDEGYAIESAPRKGYLFTEESDLLLPEEIRQGLESKVFGRNEIAYHGELDSTNTLAKELATKGAPEGTVVIAEGQSRGRGRKRRSWFSHEGGGIFVSMILRPDVPLTDAPKFTLLTAVALAETLIAHAGVDVVIKWPNDILCKGRKLAGILTEMSMEMDAVDHMVVGLGINVNIEEDVFPGELSEIATSLYMETGTKLSRVELLRRFLERFEKFYFLMEEEGFDPVIRRWRELTDVLGREVTVDLINKRITGKVVDIDENGILIVEDDRGEGHRIFSGDISYSGRKE